jgi:hypothetical protein
MSKELYLQIIMKKRYIQTGPKSSGFGPRTLPRIFFYQALDPAQDLEQLREFDALFAEKGYCQETVRAARPNCLNMIVVKLNSGGLLLYCPVQVPVPVFCTQLGYLKVLEFSKQILLLGHFQLPMGEKDTIPLLT